jgi:hypothetical protein
MTIYDLKENEMLNLLTNLETGLWRRKTEMHSRCLVFASDPADAVW